MVNAGSAPKFKLYIREGVVHHRAMARSYVILRQFKPVQEGGFSLKLFFLDS